MGISYEGSMFFGSIARVYANTYKQPNLKGQLLQMYERPIKISKSN